MVEEGKEYLVKGELDDFGKLLHQGWELKKTLAKDISNPLIEEIYQAARKAGALGGKISGAGGGGFLLLYCPVERQNRIRKTLENLSAAHPGSAQVNIVSGRLLPMLLGLNSCLFPIKGMLRR